MNCYRPILFVFLIGLSYGQDLKKERIKDPKKAFYFSLIPGMGQVYNGKLLKSAIVIGLEIAAYNACLNNLDIYNNYENGNYPLRKHRYLEKRNKYTWWVGIIYVYAMIDAVVDAHLYKFDHVMDSSLENGKKEEIIDAE
tara:strand:+ start:77 stop:496 length:420 start_codon:yes stop_codon:yes gene_type:complete